MSKPTDLVQGTLGLLILKTIALEPMHGWGIAQRIRQVSREVLQVNQGALYPALHRLEQSGSSEQQVYRMEHCNQKYMVNLCAKPFLEFVSELKLMLLLDG